MGGAHSNRIRSKVAVCRCVAISARPFHRFVGMAAFQAVLQKYGIAAVGT